MEDRCGFRVSAAGGVAVGLGGGRKGVAGERWVALTEGLERWERMEAKEEREERLRVSASVMVGRVVDGCCCGGGAGEIREECSVGSPSSSMADSWALGRERER